MNFNYESKNIAVNVYGKEYLLPKKTIGLLNKMTECQSALTEGKTTEQVKSLINSLEYILGEEFVKEHYADFDNVDTDEISALWFFINKSYAELTNKIVDEYASVETAVK